MKKYKLFIDGQWVKASNHHAVHNPYNGETVGFMPLATEADIEKAIQSACEASHSFARLSRDQKSQILHNIKDGISMQSEQFARLIAEEGGKPITLARAEVDRACLTCRLAAEEAIRFGGEWLPLDIHPSSRNFTALVGRIPLGVTLAISPFNFPLNLVMHKLAPALAVGCPVIIKPSSLTPLTALKLADICDKAGCPRGTVSVLPCSGATFEKAVVDPRPKMLSFTGSPEVGWKLKGKAGRKRVALELGGNAACVVHEDADLQFAAKRIAFGGFAHAGQICISVQRVIVHEPVFVKFIELFLKECRKIKSGDPFDENVIVGPMINSHEADRIENWVKEAVSKGARALLKGKRIGNVITPIVLADVPHDCKVYSCEAFGPVVTVEPYKTWDEALAIVNESRYGLQAGIFTRDIGRISQAYSELDVGAVIAGDIPTVRVDNYPYGGVKDSGTGREGVLCTMHELTEEKVLVLRI